MLLRTVSGSRLYGLHRPSSDYDWYTVVADKVRLSHKIRGDEDSVVVGFSRWLDLCNAGTHQALEAMFSRVPEVDEIPFIRHSYVYVGSYDKYYSAIKSFAYGTEKQRAGSLRLAFHLRDLVRYGRFNPTLSSAEVEFIRANQHKSFESTYAKAMSIVDMDYHVPQL